MPSLTPEMGSFYDVGSEMNAHKIGMLCVNFFIPLNIHHRLSSTSNSQVNVSNSAKYEVVRR